MILSNDRFSELLDTKKNIDELGEEIYNEFRRLDLNMEDFDSYSDMYNHLDKAGKDKISGIALNLEDEIEESFEDEIWEYKG